MTDNEMTLLLRSFDEQLDDADRQRLDELLEGSEELRDERARLMHLRAMVSGSRADSFNLGFADRVVDAAMPREASSRSTGWLDRVLLAMGPWRLAGGLAAAVLVILAVGITLWMQPRTVDVPYGAMETLTLSDGTTVELSGGSSLTFHRFSNDAERRVHLTGEAFFDVRRGERAFIVETFNADVRVLGTRFNVRAWPEEPEAATDVALEEGRVAVEPRVAIESGSDVSERPAQQGSQSLALQSATGPVILEPGQAAVVGADSAFVRSVSLNRVLAWRTGGFAFADQPLASVFRSIERRFAVHVTAGDVGVGRATVTYLNPDPASAEEVLADICHTLDLRYRRTSNGFEVFAPEDQ